MIELFNFIKGFFISIGDEINDNGEKRILYGIFILIGLVLFISPGYILMFFYKENTVSNSYIVLNLFSAIIIDTILFGVLFIIGLSRGVRIPKESKEPLIYKDNILNDMVITIILMATISVILMIVFAVVRFNKINWIGKIGITTFIITTSIILFLYIASWIRICYRLIIGKVRYEEAKERNNKVKQINNELPDDDDDEI